MFLANDRRGLRAPLLALFLASLLATAACGSRSVGERLDDATISTRVKTVLLNDPQVSAQKIDVDAAGGVVTISGVVSSPAEEQRAIQLARQVPGVKDVRSALQIAR